MKCPSVPLIEIVEPIGVPRTVPAAPIVKDQLNSLHRPGHNTIPRPGEWWLAIVTDVIDQTLIEVSNRDFEGALR